MSAWPNVVEAGRWIIGSDREATRKAYTASPLGSPEQCGCTHCRNFAAQRSDIYPPGVLELFDKLGIAYNREAEIYHLARLESDRHFYGGWFHLVGSVLSGADGHRQIAQNIWQPDLEMQSEFFSLGFSSRVALVRKSFEGLPLVQLEFTAKIPWVIEAEEP